MIELLLLGILAAVCSAVWALYGIRDLLADYEIRAGAGEGPLADIVRWAKENQR